jgi:hypothetical protein
MVESNYTVNYLGDSGKLKVIITERGRGEEVTKYLYKHYTWIVINLM